MKNTITNLEKSNFLYQSILNIAFKGKLISQIYDGNLAISDNSKENIIKKSTKTIEVNGI